MEKTNWFLESDRTAFKLSTRKIRNSHKPWILTFYLIHCVMKCYCKYWSVTCLLSQFWEFPQLLNHLNHLILHFKLQQKTHQSWDAFLRYKRKQEFLWTFVFDMIKMTIRLPCLSNFPITYIFFSIRYTFLMFLIKIL